MMKTLFKISSKKKAKITFIGVGSAFTKKNYNSSFILETNDKKLLVDCGRTCPEALLEQEIKWHDIDAVYISHAHADHIGGLEEFAFTRMFVPPKIDKPVLFCESKTLKDLWEHSLKGGLEPGKNRDMLLDDYFDPRYVDEKFTWQEIDFEIFPVNHLMKSYGLAFEVGDDSILFSSDSTFDSAELKKRYEDATIIFQDCETSKGKSGIHAHYSELKELSKEIKEKMWLYHYQDGELPSFKDDGFAGFINVGQTFEVG